MNCIGNSKLFFQTAKMEARMGLGDLVETKKDVGERGAAREVIGESLDNQRGREETGSFDRVRLGVHALFQSGEIVLFEGCTPTYSLLLLYHRSSVSIRFLHCICSSLVTTSAACNLLDV